jgi:hypothetical protein
VQSCVGGAGAVHLPPTHAGPFMSVLPEQLATPHSASLTHWTQCPVASQTPFVHLESVAWNGVEGTPLVHTASVHPT